MTCSIEKDRDNCEGLCQDQPHIWNQKSSGRRTGNNCAVEMLTGTPRPMQGLHLQRPKEYDVRTFQLQSSPCCGIQAYRTYRSTRTGWSFGNVGSEHHSVISASATIGRDLRLDTFKICVFLKKETEQSIDGKKVPLRCDRGWTSVL